MMRKNGFNRCTEMYVDHLRKEGRYSTTHVYESTLLSFRGFCGTPTASFGQVTHGRLRCYGQYLYEHGLKLNTVSTHMRMLHSIYNRGVESGGAPYVHQLFRGVCTGVDVRQRKALPATGLYKLLYGDPRSDILWRTQAVAVLMFQFCGMSFADLTHLEESSLGRSVLHYNHIKTKTPMSVEILDTAKDMIYQLQNRKPALQDCPDYLFSVLNGNKKRKDGNVCREYQSTFRSFSNHLRGLAKALRLTSPVTSYTIRHSWVTTAKYRRVPIEMISESLECKSIKTTQIYLEGFALKECTEVNRMGLSYIKNCLEKSVNNIKY